MIYDAERRVGRKGWAGLAIGLIFCWGCGASTPPVSTSAEEATVHGSVTIHGKPASGGKVFFNPTNIKRPNAPTATADIGQDGAYTLKTLVGENQVSVETPETKKDVSLASAMVLDVKSGDNSFNIPLPSP